MRLVLAFEQRFDRTPDGKIWTPNAFAYGFYQRYLAVFESVRVVARVRDVKEAPGALRADGPLVDFYCIPYFVGPWQFLTVYFQMIRKLRGAVSGDDAVILRSPGQVGAQLWHDLRRRDRPFGVEAVGDPYDVFAPGVVRHPLRPYLRFICSRQLRRLCATSVCAVYVTRAALQRRYPSPGHTISCSDVQLPPLAPPRSADSFLRKPLRLVGVGTLEQLYKGPDILLGALALCAKQGLTPHLTWVGEGCFRPQIEGLIKKYGLGEQVRLTGALKPEEVMRELDAADVFMMPSRTEGLPRALLEAMARGLPCLGSNIGGIPELLAPEDLFPPGVVEPLAAKLAEVLVQPERLAAMSARSLVLAAEYQPDVLLRRWRDFYLHLRRVTETWARARTVVAMSDKTNEALMASRPGEG
jgi:glycosyltransferase involved in cell wall biosynthesis